MPLYEYRCENCGEQFEVMQKFADKPLTTHDACGGNVHRLLSAPALQFKGSGWYVNDYAKGSTPNSNSQSKPDSSSKSESSTSGKTSSDGGSSTSTSTGTPASDTK